MSSLTDPQLAELRAELERELARLRRTMSSTQQAAHPVELDQSSMGRLSRVDALQSQQLTRELHEREVARESELVDALRRMDEGEYGRCQSCGADIPYARLLVMPEARRCARCGTT